MKLFRSVLNRACTCKVFALKQNGSFMLFTISKYRKEGFQKRVAFCPYSSELTCSCEIFESFGILCEHLIVVLVQLDIVIFPESLVLARWTRGLRTQLLSQLGTKKIVMIHC